MLKKHRKTEILRFLENHDFLSTEQAVEMLKASPATIRRDFHQLAENNSVKKVKGGVRPLPIGSNASIPFFMRQHWFSGEKTHIAKRATEFAPSNGVIFIHSGSTTLELGHYIDSGTIITNSLMICELLRSRFPAGGGPEVILPGGIFDFKAGVLAGSRTERVIMEYHADVAFFSSRGMDEEGLLDTNDQLAAVARAMITRADRTVMLADHSKFKKFGMSRMVLWKDIDIIITDDYPDNYPFFEKIKKHGVEIVLV